MISLRAWLANKIVTPPESDCNVPRRLDGRRRDYNPNIEVRRFGRRVDANVCVAYDLDRQFVVRYLLDRDGRPFLQYGEIAMVTEYGGISAHWTDRA